MKATALYLRLSSEDDMIGESDSVKNQRDLLYSYINKSSEFADSKIMEFCDDGYSGTNFERPGVKEMLELVKAQEIGCIIVKDFSRFGRNYVEVCTFLERVFPFLGVRFISVNDNFDSNNYIGCTAGIDVAFKALIHDLYCKDVSMKTRIAHKTKARKGEYLSMLAPFGYMKSSVEKNKLAVDEQTAPIIRRIFNMALSGMKLIEIARILNAENVVTPYMYRKQNNTLGGRGWKVVSEDKNYWTGKSIKRTLCDERYVGNLVSGKRTTIGVNSRKSVPVPKEEWIVAKNAHEAIISEEDFQNVQKLFRTRKTDYDVKECKSPYTGKLKCGQCGHTLTVRYHAESYSYFCGTRRFVENVTCIKDDIPNELLDDIVLSGIKKQINLVTEAKKRFDRMTEEKNQAKKADVERIKKLRLHIEQLRLKKEESFERYVDGLISKESFISLKEDCAKKTDEITREITELENRVYEMPKAYSNCFDVLKTHTGEVAISKELIDTLVERIIIYSAERIEIVWRFADEIALLSAK